MASQAERLTFLKDFPLRGVVEVLDEENDVEYLLSFIPKLNVLTVMRSDAGDEPPIAMSYGAFTSFCKGLKLNKKNKLDSVLKYLIDAWDAVAEDTRMAFYNDVPLNSLFMGRQYI
jgi:hypothetical protein